MKDFDSDELWRDYRIGEAIIFSGYVEKKEREDHADYPTAYYINLDGREHQINGKYYYRIQDHDYVTIRKAPRTNCTVSVVISHQKENI